MAWCGTHSSWPEEISAGLRFLFLESEKLRKALCTAIKVMKIDSSRSAVESELNVLSHCLFLLESQSAF